VIVSDIFFFFSSRRRHTRFDCDWSSDVCSSDLSDTVDHLTQAINRGDLEAALALYEPNAVLVVQPGHLACGTTQLREALARFIALEPTLRSEAQEVIAAGDLALYAGRWTLRGMDPNGHPVVMNG